MHGLTVTPRRSNLPLPLRLLLRRLRSPEGRLAPLAVLSIAVSVALATGLEMSSRSAQLQLERTAEAITGAAKVEVVAGRVGIPESMLEEMRRVPGVRAASPMISAKFRLADQPFVLDVIGVDLLAEEQVRPMAVSRGGVRVRDPLHLIASANSVIVTQQLLDRLGLSEQWSHGEPTEIAVTIAGKSARLVVQGILEPGGVASAYGGQIAIMDVYALQLLVGRAGLFDRIDVVPEPGVDVSHLVDAINGSIRGGVTAHASLTRAKELEDAVGLIRSAAVVIAFIGALSAALLSYAASVQWVDRQRKQLATFRAVGMEAHRVQRGVLLEIGLLAVAGTAIGVCGGIGIAPLTLSTLSTFAVSEGGEELTSLAFLPTTAATAILVGVASAFVGSAAPAIRAGRRFTLDSLDLQPSRATGRALWKYAASLSAAVFLAAWGLASSAFAGSAVVRVAVLFLSGVVLIFSLGPFLLNRIMSLLRPLRELTPSLGHLVLRAHAAHPWGFAVSLTAISSLVAALTAVFLLVETVTRELDEWTTAGDTGGTLILPEPLTEQARIEVLSPSTVERIHETPGVTAVEERMGASVMFRGEEVPLLVRTMKVVSEHGYLGAIGRQDREVAMELAGGGVAVSVGFQRYFGISPGDQLELETPNGLRSFPVVGVFEDFGGATGSIQLDVRVYEANWTRSRASSVMVWTDSNRDLVVERIRESVGSSQDLFFVNAQDVARYNRKLAGAFSRVLYALSTLVALLGGFAVAILLYGVVAERRRDLSQLRAAGAAPSSLVLVVVLDAAIVAAAAATVGLLLGLACAGPVTDVLREQFGWALEQRWFAQEILIAGVGTVAAGIAGGLAPAWVAYRTLAVDAFAPE